MRLLICVATMEGGGAERQVTYLARALLDAGQEVHVALLRRGVLYTRLAASGATIHELDLYPFSRRFLGPVFSLLRAVRPDLVYLWLQPFDVLGGLACIVAGVPCVHAERTDPVRIADGLKVRLRRLIVPRGAGVIANSEAGAAYWKRAGVPSQRIALIGNAVPYDELQCVPAAAETEGHAVVVGRLDEGKNVLRLVDAVALLARAGTTLPLSIVGGGALAGEIRQRAERSGPGGHVRLLGFRADAWSLMKGSSVFVSVSHYEGEPNAVLEARALGCRLLLSDIPSHRVAADGANAVFVRPDSVDDIALGLAAVMRSAPRPDGGGHPSAPLERSAAAVAARHVAFFERVLGGRTHTTPPTPTAGGPARHR